MADITYNFSIGKGKRLNVLFHVIKAMWTGKFVITTPDLQPNVEPMDFSEANFKEMKRQRNHFANQNALLRKKMEVYGASHAQRTCRPMTEAEAAEVEAIFAKADTVFNEASKMFDRASQLNRSFGHHTTYRKFDA